MNAVLNALLQLTRPFDPTRRKGFTVLELMIVLLIAGILASIALPTMIRHVGKSRETEASQTLSSIGFSQQGYFFEYRQFASNYSDLGVGITPTNYDFPSPESPPGALRTKSRAISRDNGLTGSRDYAIGVYYQSDAYIIAFCRGADLGITTQVPDDPAGNCTNGGERLD